MGKLPVIDVVESPSENPFSISLERADRPPVDDLRQIYPECLDKHSLDLLKHLGGPQAVKKRIQIFLDYTPIRIHSARLSEQSGDIEATGLALRSLKPSCKQVGAVSMYALCEAAEAFMAENDSDMIVPILDALDAEFVQVKAFLQGVVGATA